MRRRFFGVAVGALLLTTSGCDQREKAPAVAIDTTLPVEETGAAAEAMGHVAGATASPTVAESGESVAPSRQLP